MGELLLCSHGLAYVPYYIETIALNVYSLEELCCYMVQNMDLLGPSFMEDELIEWIDAELEMHALAGRLRDLKSDGMRLSAFVTTLAESCNYCSGEEISSMQKVLLEYENKSETECRKIRADRLLQKKRYGESILEYRKLLEVPGVCGALAGNIYHNLGTAYAGLFCFWEAADCYGKAYERNRNPLSLQQQQSALMLAEDTLPDQKEQKDDGVPPEELLRRWKEAYIKGCK